MCYKNSEIFPIKSHDTEKSMASIGFFVCELFKTALWRTDLMIQNHRNRYEKNTMKGQMSLSRGMKSALKKSG